jgi:hypothetical protein
MQLWRLSSFDLYYREPEVLYSPSDLSKPRL